MGLELVADDYGRKQLVGVRRSGREHPIGMPTGLWQILALMVGIEQALAGSREVNPRFDEENDRFPYTKKAAELQRQAHELIRNTRQALAELEEQRQALERERDRFLNKSHCG